MLALTSIAPIFILLAVGYVLRARGLVQRTWIRSLNGFVYYVSLPALICLSMLQLDWTQAQTFKTLGLNTLFVALSSIFFLIIIRILPIQKNRRAVLYLASVISNSVYLGIPLIARVFSAERQSVLYAQITVIAVVHLVMGMVCALIGIELLQSKKKDMASIVRHLMVSPLVIAFIVGFLLVAVFGSHGLPNVIDATLGMLSATASPLALCVLGAFLYGKSVHQNTRLIVLASTSKLILLPTMAYVFFTLLGTGIPEKSIAILSAGMPTAATAFVLSDTYKLDTKFTASAMLVSTLSCIVTQTVIIYLLRS